MRRILILLAPILLASCASTGPDLALPGSEPSPVNAAAISTQEGLPTGTLSISDPSGAELLEVHVEIAEESSTRQIGLMFVEDLPDDTGMVFLWDFPHQGAFHMLNTLIPLEIAFWDEDGEIVDILQMQPCATSTDCPTYRPDSEYIGAVEVEQGALAGAGIESGDLAKVIRDS